MATTKAVFGGPVPVTDLAHCVAAYQSVLHTLGRLDDAGARGPSLLPEWSRGHVVTHLARHADSLVRVLEGLSRGEQIPQYAGGEKSRAAEIRKGAGRKAATLVDDFQRSNEELFAVWESLEPEHWAEEVSLFHGKRPASATAWSRWFELSVHHVDLDLGFGIDQWPRAFVGTALRQLVDRASGRGADDSTSVERVVVLRPTDDPTSYRIDADGRSIGGEEEPGDAVVEGPAAHLVWWLLGRRSPTLDVAGPLDDPAADLPARFPYA